MFEILHNREIMGSIYSTIELQFDDNLTFNHRRMLYVIDWFRTNCGDPIYHPLPLTFVSDKNTWFQYDFQTICVRDPRLLVRFKLEFVG